MHLFLSGNRFALQINEKEQKENQYVSDVRFQFGIDLFGTLGVCDPGRNLTDCVSAAL